MQNSGLHWDLLSKAVDKIQSRDLGEYFELKKLLADQTETSRIEFQARFTKYYGLNSGGLTEALIRRFFELLFAFDPNKSPDPYTAPLLDLHRLPTRRGYHSLQASFVSKLVAIYDESRPIFDTHVSKFFGITPPSIGPIEFRIVGFVSNLDIVKTRYTAWACSPLFKKVTAPLHMRFP